MKRRTGVNAMMRWFSISLALLLLSCGCGSSASKADLDAAPDLASPSDADADSRSKTDPDVHDYDLNDSFDVDDPGACNENVSFCVAWYCNCGVCTTDQIECVRKSWADQQGCPLGCDVLCPDLALTPCHCSAGRCAPL